MGGGFGGERRSEVSKRIELEWVEMPSPPGARNFRAAPTVGVDQNRIVNFAVYGAPEPKHRHRSFKTKGGTIQQYADPRNAPVEDKLRRAFVERVGADWKPHEGPVKLAVSAGFPVPKSRPKWMHRLVEDEKGMAPHTVRPDLDNIVKMVCDALSGIAWRNDTQVYEIRASKWYHPVPATWVTMEFMRPTTKEDAP